MWHIKEMSHGMWRILCRLSENITFGSGFQGTISAIGIFLHMLPVYSLILKGF